MKTYQLVIFVLGICLFGGCGVEDEKAICEFEHNVVAEFVEEINYILDIQKNSISSIEVCSEEDNISDPANVKKEYFEYMSDRALVNMDYEEEFWECINENSIDKVYKLGPKVTTEDRIRTAVANKDCWLAEIEHALSILKENLEEDQYNALVSSYEGWKQYMEPLTEVETDLFYLGGVAGDPETYPHVTEVKATRTKDYAIQLLALEYAVTGKIEFEFQVSEEDLEEEPKIIPVDIEEYDFGNEELKACIQANVVLEEGTEIEDIGWVDEEKTCMRVSIRYQETPQYRNYDHKDDYFFFIEEDIIKVLYVDYPNDANMTREVWADPDFNAHFEDVNFDGNDDLIIALGLQGDDAKYCAYLYTEKGYEYCPSFEKISQYEVDYEKEQIASTYYEVILGVERPFRDYYVFKDNMFQKLEDSNN